ncbi:activity-regulated cytoskeleton associated protein 2-like [Maniola jurtina]|uniref:activity-regulated cytoskeleton associated protein 2-like n=1 Tax=Maniola jurtina TaxID=191418 RepID=UPI001E68EA7E|nr:activity-regulated cytoskeleton associated protein 2-like [Maniola jurtina]
MSAEHFSTLMTSLQKQNADMCERLIREVRSSTPLAGGASSPVQAGNNGNFSKCSSRYSGASNECVEGFIDAIQVYKSCLQITDDNAVKGLSMLLSDKAALWWQGVRKSVADWDDAILRLQSAFGARRPPFVIYRELFALAQKDENTDIFISKVRSLFAKLPEEDLCERVELDMTYSLLDRRIRKRLDRDEIKSFDDLLRKARSIEDSLKESELVPSKGSQELKSKKTPTTVPSSSTPVPAANVQRGDYSKTADTTAGSPAKESTTSRPRTRVFCVYCKSNKHDKIKRDFKRLF